MQSSPLGEGKFTTHGLVQRMERGSRPPSDPRHVGSELILERDPCADE